MAISIFIAQVMAIMFLSVALGFLFNKNYYKKELVKVLDDPGFMMLGGMMALVLGMLIIHYHNTWESNWTVVITIIGWISVIKGISFFVFPKFATWFKPLFHGKMIDYLVVLLFIIGLIFGYWGFFL